MFVDAGTHVARRFVQNERDVLLRQLENIPPVGDGFCSGVELETDVLDHRAVHGDVACPYRLFRVSL